MKGSKLPVLWIAPDGFTLRARSMTHMAQMLGCNKSNVAKAIAGTISCMGGTVVVDDGRPALPTLDAMHVAYLNEYLRSIYHGGRRPRRLIELARKARAESLEAQQRPQTPEEIWAEREAYLLVRQRMAADIRRKQAERDAYDHAQAAAHSVEWLPGPISTMERSQDAIDAAYREYCKAQPSEEEKIVIERRKRILSVPHRTGYYFPGLNPVICPCCGRLLTGCDADKHIRRELSAACDQGREFAFFAGGILRVTDGPTGFIQEYKDTHNNRTRTIKTI